MPITQPQIDALKALNVQESTLLTALVADAVVVVPPPLTVNTYISRTNPGTLVSVDSGGNLSWGMYGTDVGGLTSFWANGSSSTAVLGTKLVLQAGSAYAKQLDGSWKMGARFGPKSNITVVVVDPAP